MFSPLIHSTLAEFQLAAIDQVHSPKTPSQASDDLMAMADELLTVDGFDPDKVAALLEGSDISEGEKTTLATALGFAKDKPTLLEPVLENIRNLLGM